MLKQTLLAINEVLDKLILITKQDIDDIKKANHEALFERNTQKELLIDKFNTLKSQIDNTLVQRSQQGLDITEMLNPEEDKLFDEFKDKLQDFYLYHKKFSKMALVVANFYNNLVHKITGQEIDIGYEMRKPHHSNFSLKV